MNASFLGRARLGNTPLIPLMAAGAACGFPSPADDYIDRTLSLDQLMIINPPATFFVRAVGESMTGAGIFDGDLLVVDRSVTPKHGAVVVAVLNGESLVKRFYHRGGRMALHPAHPDFPVMHVQDGMDFEVWGVVQYVVHALK